MAARIACSNLCDHRRLAVVPGTKPDGYGILDPLSVLRHSGGRFLGVGVIFGEYAHQNMPFGSLVDILGVPDTAGQDIQCRSVLIKTLLNLAHYDLPPIIS